MHIRNIFCRYIVLNILDIILEKKWKLRRDRINLNSKSTTLPIGSGSPSIFRIWQSNKNTSFLSYTNKTFNTLQVRIVPFPVWLEFKFLICSKTLSLYQNISLCQKKKTVWIIYPSMLTAWGNLSTTNGWFMPNDLKRMSPLSNM